MPKLGNTYARCVLFVKKVRSLVLFCFAQIEHDGIIWLFAFLSSQIKFICNNNFVCFLEWRLGFNFVDGTVISEASLSRKR